MKRKHNRKLSPGENHVILSSGDLGPRRSFLEKPFGKILLGTILTICFLKFLIDFFIGA